MVAQKLVVAVEQVEKGVEQEREEVEGHEQGGKMLLAVTEIMFEMVALGFESVIVLILDLPTRTSSSDDVGNDVVVETMAGSKAVAVADRAIGLAYAQLAPVD